MAHPEIPNLTDAEIHTGVSKKVAELLNIIIPRLCEMCRKEKPNIPNKRIKRFVKLRIYKFWLPNCLKNSKGFWGEFEPVVDKAVDCFLEDLESGV
jgi:hypothetical protein